MAVFQALAGVLVPATVALVGYWIKRQSERRLALERDQTEMRLQQEHAEARDRLRLDAAMRAAGLFGDGDSAPNAASSASGLLALTQLGHADLAVALLVDLWSMDPETLADIRSTSPPDVDHDAGPCAVDTPEPAGSVSTETAILVINGALRSLDTPNAQLVAAELLCRNSIRLNPCQSLHWPAAIDGRWLPDLAPRAKLLVIEGLILMTTNSRANENALRSLAVRLYGVWKGDAGNARVQGCVGTLIAAVLPPLQRLGYSDFMQARETVTLAELEAAALSATSNPDGFLERLVKHKAKDLEAWAAKIEVCDFGPGALATASN